MSANGYPLDREVSVRPGGSAETVVNLEPDVLYYLI